MLLRSLLLIALVFVAHTVAADMREIQLKDGSVITGNVRSFDGDTYVIETDSLGTISLSNTKIQAIRAIGGQLSGHQSEQLGGLQGAQTIPPQELMAIQQRLMNDGDILEMIKALQDDPQITAILNDPKLLNAISSGDVQTLMNNPQFKALMENPKIQEISSKVSP